MEEKELFTKLLGCQQDLEIAINMLTDNTSNENLKEIQEISIRIYSAVCRYLNGKMQLEASKYKLYDPNEKRD